MTTACTSISLRRDGRDCIASDSGPESTRGPLIFKSLRELDRVLLLDARTRVHTPGLERLVAAYSRFVVDCGGDIAVGGIGAQLEPYEIAVEHPVTGASVGTLQLTRGGVATSGLNVRIWRNEDGSFAHHLLDPSTGRPAWTGVVGATALGTTALEAETLSKMALLLGPVGARRVLAEHGGLIVHDHGDVEPIGPIDLRPAREAAVGVLA